MVNVFVGYFFEAILINWQELGTKSTKTDY